MKLIKPQGVPSNILICGDYPTQNEYSLGTSFAGSTGTMLSNLLAPFPIKVSQTFRTHYFKVPVSGFSSPSKKIQKESVLQMEKLDNWDWYFKEELEAANPNVILAMGELALSHLTEESNIKKWRGSILHLHPRFGRPNIKVIPTHSPREIWEQQEHPLVYVQWDCGKLCKVQNSNARFRPAENIWIARNATEISNWWIRARSAPFITLDIETHYGFVTCIGFSHNGTEAFSVPLLVGPPMDHHSRGQMYKMVDVILKSAIPKVNQNIKYDSTILENFGFTVNNIIGDTMLMAHTIYPELPVGLDFLNSIYTDLPYYKDEGKKFDPKLHNVDRLLRYNARDALCTWQIWKQQQEDADAFKVKHFYFKYVQPAFFTYKKMDQRGVRVDDERRKSLIAKYEPMLYEHQTTINMIAEKSVNINSPTQVGRFIYEILQCPKQTHMTPAGNVAYNTDEDAIEELYVNKVTDVGRKTVLKSVIVARKLYRVLQFLTNPISLDGRMRTSYKIQGTETGRTSAGKSIEPFFEVDGTRIGETECGGSFQTIPKHGYEFGPIRIGADLREIFVPSPGYTFVEGDQGQAEDRVVCVLAEDWDGLSILNKKEFRRNNYGLKDDRHTLTAMMITSKTFEEITPDDRQIRGKKPRHAGNYEMTAFMLAIFTHLPLSICKQILERFHATNPKIRGTFHNTVKDIINRLRYLVSPHGRRRDFFGRVTDAMYRQALATIPQATITDHNKFTILQGLVDKYNEVEAAPISESHDSNLFEVRNDLVPQFIDDFHKVIETPIYFGDCIIPRDYHLVIPGEIGKSQDNWAACK